MVAACAVFVKQKDLSFSTLPASQKRLTCQMGCDGILRLWERDRGRVKVPKIKILAGLVGALLCLSLAGPAVAQNPGCQNLPRSAGAPPPGCLAASGSSPQAGRTPLDNAFGPENTNERLSSLILNVPQTLNNIGPLLDPADPNFGFINSCDFDNSGLFDKLFCLGSGPNAILFTVHTTTGAITQIGPTVSFGGEFFTSMSMDPTTGIMYVTSFDDTVFAPSSLYTINLTTGTATRIGPITNSTLMIGTGFNNTGQMFGYDVDNDSLMRIDKTTGAGTIIGPLGFNANFGQGMDFDESDDTCYLFAFNNTTFVSELRTCNTTTGATTLVGLLGSITPGSDITQMGAGAIATTLPGIPTLPQWGMLLLTLSLLTLATWELAGRPAVLMTQAVGNANAGLAVDYHQLPHSLLVGQGVAWLSLALYAAVFGSLMPHDAIGTLLAGLCIGLMVEFYGRNTR